MNIYQIIALIIAVGVSVYLLDVRIRSIVSTSQNGVKAAALDLAAVVRSKVAQAEQRFSQEEKDLIMAVATTIEEGLAQLTALIGEVPPAFNTAVSNATTAKDQEIATLTADKADLQAKLDAVPAQISAAVSAGAATLGVVDPTV
jgi:hypothetical protein